MGFLGPYPRGVFTPTIVSGRDSSILKPMCGGWATPIFWVSSGTTSRTLLGSIWWNSSKRQTSIGLIGLSMVSSASLKKTKLMEFSRMIFQLQGIPKCWRIWSKWVLLQGLLKDFPSPKVSVVSWSLLLNNNNSLNKKDKMSKSKEEWNQCYSRFILQRINKKRFKKSSKSMRWSRQEGCSSWILSILGLRWSPSTSDQNYA